jgi:signal peptidase I
VNPAVETAGEFARVGGEPGTAPLVTETAPETASPDGAAGVEVKAERIPKVEHRHGFLQAFQSLATIIVVALFIITFTVQPFRIPSESMEPTLLVGDFLLVDKEVSSNPHLSLMAPTDQIHRGDLVVFHYPIEPSLHLVKRVVGLPGDHVRLRDGHVFIDGHAIPEPYAVFRPAAPDGYRDEFPRLSSVDAGIDSRWWIQMHSLVANGELTVPRDSFFVLGDNRNDSEDSRYWGFVPRATIVGKPFLVYFSLRTLDDRPGQLRVGDAGAATGKHSEALGSLGDFARWDRALHVIH